MKKLFALCVLLMPLLLNAQTPLIQNIYGRNIEKLNGSWNILSILSITVITTTDWP